MAQLIAEPGDTLVVVGPLPKGFWYKVDERYTITGSLVSPEDGLCYNVEGSPKTAWIRAMDCVVERRVAEQKLTEDEEYSGGSVDYYKVWIENPTTAEEAYMAECNDIIEALGMNYAEGNAFKALWRSCAARTLGKRKKGQDAEGLYDAQKVVFFGKRMVVQRGGEL